MKKSKGFPGKIVVERMGPYFGDIGKGTAVGVGIAWLFYRSVIGLAAVLPAVLFFLKQGKKRRKEEEAAGLRRAFCEYLGFLQESLTAGHSLESAVWEAQKGMDFSSEGGRWFSEALERLLRKRMLGVSVEDAFLEMARECDCEEMREFAEVLVIARKTGGALRQVIENTEGILNKKEETLRSIRSMVAGRVFENNLMKLMPFAMLGYLNLGMPEFLDPLYHNLFGVLIMSVVLLLYGILCVITDKMVSATQI